MSWNSKLSFGAHVCPWFVTLADKVLVVFVAEFWILCSAVFPVGERRETRMNIVRLGQWCSYLKNGCLVWMFQTAFLMLSKPNVMQIKMVLQQCDCAGAKTGRSQYAAWLIYKLWKGTLGASCTGIRPTSSTERSEVRGQFKVQTRQSDRQIQCLF